MDDIATIALKRLDLRFEPTLWDFATERRAEIDAHFLTTQVGTPELYNGRVLLLRRWSLDGDTFRGAYLETDFASMLAWRDFGFPDTAIFNCFGMAVLRSADNAYLLGEMGAHTANAGRIYFPAGTPEPEDVTGGAVDLAGNVARELAEETGLSADAFDVTAGWTCVRVGPRFAMMQEMQSRDNAEDLRRRILGHLASEKQPELSGIHIVRGPADVDPQRMPPWITEYFRHVWA